MKIKLFPLIVLFLSILGASCTEQVGYNKEQLLDLIRVGDPTADAILPKSINSGVSCSDYSKGCLSAHTIRVRNLDLIAVEFSSRKEASFAAKKFRGYFAENWLLDDVTGEPVLEKFVVKYLKAKKP